MHDEKTGIISVRNQADLSGNPNSCFLLASRNPFEDVWLGWMSSDLSHSLLAARLVVIQQFEEAIKGFLLVWESVEDHVPIA